jgi:hypothetical protein
LAFGIAGYALAQIVMAAAWINFAVWFAGAALLHDLVLLPLYSGVGGVVRTNYIRVPALIAGLLLLVYFPLILDLDRAKYVLATGHQPEGYLRNWLLITAGLFLVSGAVWVVRRRRS